MSRARLLRAPALALASLLSACAVLEPPPPRPVPSAGELAAARPQAFSPQELAARNDTQRMLSNDQRPVASTPPRPDAGVVGEFNIDRRSDASRISARGGVPRRPGGPPEPEVTLQFFEPASLRRIVEIMLGEVLRVPHVFADDFKDKQVRLFFSGKGTRDELIRTFDSLIEMQGVRLRYLDGVYLVSTEERSRRAQPSPDGIGETTGVVRLRYMETRDFLPIARQLMLQGDRAHVLAGQNSLLMIASGSEIRAVQRLAEEIDVPYFEGKHVTIYAPRYLSARALVTLLDQHQTQLGSTAAAPNRQIETREIPDQDRVIIVTSNATARDLAMEIVSQVDLPGAQNRRHVFQFQLSTHKAPEITGTLKALLSQVMRGVAPPIDPVADRDSNSVFIFATPEEYAQIRGLLERLDARPPAVHIDVTIAEVVLNNQTQFGVEWFLRNSVGGTNLTLNSNFNVGRQLANSFDLFVSRGSRFAILQMLSAVTDFSILSSPQIVVKNGYTAKINVGGEEPVIKSRLTTTQTAGGSNLPQTEYANQKVGLELEVTPFIGTGGEVKLTMLLKETRLGEEKTLSDGTTQPRLSTREVKTEFVTADGSTVFIGGIRQKRDQTSLNKTPGLGDVPYLGWLFRNKTDTAEFTEMIVLATPTVIIDQTSADRITRAILNARRDRDAPPGSAPAAEPQPAPQSQREPLAPPRPGTAEAML